MDWMNLRVEWPNFDNENEEFLFLTYPPISSSHYRREYMNYWHKVFPNIQNYTAYVAPTKRTKVSPPRFPLRSTLTPAPFPRNKETHYPPRKSPPEVFGKIMLSPDDPPVQNVEHPAVGHTTQKSGWTMNTLIVLGGVFLAANLILFLALYYKCTNRKNNNPEEKANNEDPNEIAENSSKNATPFDPDGCNIIGMIMKASKTEAVKVSEDASSSKAKLTRNMSNSTLDAHTKVREWITQEIVQRCSPGFLRRSRDSEQSNFTRIKPPLLRSDAKTIESNSTLGRSPTRPVSPDESPTIIKTIPQSTKKSSEKGKSSNIPKLPSQQSSDKGKHKHRGGKVSVAIDATPAGRGSSVMRQQPIELTKSLDCTSSGIEKEVPLRRSVTLEDICTTPKPLGRTAHIRKSSTNINVQYRQMQEPTLVKIQHFHSKSDPIQDLYSFTPPPKLKTFSPDTDVNVTSREETTAAPQLTPEQALLTIKRRNFPKVLPDLPGHNESLTHKRRSMPVPNLSTNPPEGKHSRTLNKPHPRLAPIPPPRTSSSLGRQDSGPSPMCHSAPVLATEPPLPEEPEMTFNNLYFGPLAPARKPEPKSPQEIYESLKPQRPTEPKPMVRAIPKAIVTADPERPIRRPDPKVVIKPKIARNASKSAGIPRVTVNDNATYVNLSDLKNEQAVEEKAKVVRPSQIPKKIKDGDQSANKGSSSSESTTPSEESDTGTVVKRK